MRSLVALSALALIGAAPPPSPDARLRAIVTPVSQQQLRHSIETLVSFGTRHTLSSPTVRPCATFTGDRIPKPTRVCDMVAIQRGTERPNDVVIITAHIDSRVTDIMNANAFEPGANDAGSGSAAVLEAAGGLSKRKFPGT